MTDGARGVGRDAGFVTLAYGVSFLYPLASLPLLSRVLGAGQLGRLVFVLSLLYVVTVIVEFGFNISALRRVAVSGGPAERGEILASTLGAKLLLWFAVSLVTLALCWAVPSLRADAGLVALGLSLVGGGALFPEWLLKGMGRVRTFTVLMAGSRLLALGGLLLTVRGPDQLPLAVVWQLIPQVIAAAACAPLVWRSREIGSASPHWRGVFRAWSDAVPVFIGNLALVGMGAANTVVLGLISSQPQVAYFGAAERFANAGRGVMGGVQTVMLPRMIAAEEGGAEQVRERRIVITGMLAGYGLGGLALVVCMGWFVPWYLGPGYDEVVPVGRILGVCLAITGIASVFILRAQAAHRFSAVARTSGVSALVHLVLLVIGGALGGARGAAWALLATEVIQAALFWLDSRRHFAGRSRRHVGAAQECS